MRERKEYQQINGDVWQSSELCLQICLQLFLSFSFLDFPLFLLFSIFILFYFIIYLFIYFFAYIGSLINKDTEFVALE